MKSTNLNRFRAVFMALTLIVAALISSCQYEFIEPERIIIDPTVEIKFAQEIAPIFSNNNACTACHRTGATPPDLTAERAYNAIVPAYVNTANPEQSSIYWFAHPNSTTHNWKKLTLSEAALILEWIKQGAKNN
ncbi:MAG TPA: hypothetical protein PKE03_06255 [Bacteroidales bacterium]|nr:hypothetical protein [Bacteroidales bacterium]